MAASTRNFRGLSVAVYLCVAMTTGISTAGSETVLFSCDFEEDFCGLIQSTIDDFNWQRHEGSTPTSNTGPESAFTGSYYIFLEANSHWNDHATIHTETLPFEGDVCMTFAYHMNGDDRDEMYMYVITSSSEHVEWRRSGHQGKYWQEATIQLAVKFGDRVHLEGHISSHQRSDIALDDLTIRTGSCKRQVSLPFSCTFESDLCGLTQSNADQFDWWRHTGHTPTSWTGPTRAYEGSWYLYTEADYPINDDRAIVETPAFDHRGSVCVRFRYHMYGSDPFGFLIVWHQNEAGQTRAFREDGNQGNQWKFAQFTVSAFEPGDWITIIGLRKHWRGDIAIDDLLISADECNACQVNNGGCRQLCLRPSNETFICSCEDGYLLQGMTDCSDINECDTANGHCAQQCNNTHGSFSCYCEDGYSLSSDGYSCDDIDECETNNNNCQQECNNTEGGYSCHCSHGYSMPPGGPCEDINECENDVCEHTCNNSPGSYRCSCGSGYALSSDSRSCRAVAAIAGGTVAAAAVIAVAIVLVLVMLRRRRSQREKPDREVAYYASASAVGPRTRVTIVQGHAEATKVDPEDGFCEPVAVYAVVKPKEYRKPAPAKSKSLKWRAPDRVKSKKDIATAKHIPDETPGNGFESDDTTVDFESATKSSTGSRSAPPSGTSGDEDGNQYYNLLPRRPRNTSDFLKNVKKLRKDDGFYREYKTLPTGKLFPWKDAVREGLSTKNRFKNIYPYDTNRVCLSAVSGDPLSDYINASHIRGQDDEDVYIASHGPSDFTKADFWRMIWEQNIELVVMVTNLIEADKVRCVKYWPDKDEEREYDGIVITETTESSFLELTVRIFSMKKGSEERSVEQFHYTSWPDHGVPEDATTMLRFHKRIRQRMRPGKPVLVHCSAGVGRTGTFIAIDILLTQAEKEGKVDVYNCVNKLRLQRVQMVQTQKQYIFLHDALLEALMVGDTTISCDTFHEYMKTAKEATKRQFEVLIELLQPSYTDEDRSLALRDGNRDKNRDTAIIPRYSKRVFLTSQEEGRNDYINAVFVRSYRKKNAFIVTQLPLERTTIDFWRMIHDLRCDTVILLGHSMKELCNNEADGDFAIGSYDITRKKQTESGGGSFPATVVTVAKYTHQPTYENITPEHQTEEEGKPEGQLSQSASCRVIEVAAEGPEDLACATMSRLYAVVQDGRRGTDRHIVFVCRDGPSLCGVAVACFSLFEMMSAGGAVDIFHVTKQVKDSRPEFISTIEQYKHLHDLAGEHIKQFGTYSNFLR